MPFSFSWHIDKLGKVHADNLVILQEAEIIYKGRVLSYHCPVGIFHPVKGFYKFPEYTKSHIPYIIYFPGPEEFIKLGDVLLVGPDGIRGQVFFKSKVLYI